MFGYIQPDIPHMYVKDGILYRAMYCGLCKSLGGCCGQRSRLALSYDMTFLSLLLHNIKNTDVKIEQRRCALHPFVRRPVTADDELTSMLACLNTALTYHKLCDDVEDEHKGRAARALSAGRTAGRKSGTRGHAPLYQSAWRRFPSWNRRTAPAPIWLQTPSPP